MNQLALLEQVKQPPEQAQEMHQSIRSLIAEKFGEETSSNHSNFMEVL